MSWTIVTMRGEKSMFSVGQTLILTPARPSWWRLISLALYYLRRRRDRKRPSVKITHIDEDTGTITLSRYVQQ